MNFRLGSDPELMLRRPDTKELVSAIPVIREGKGEGRPLDDTGENSVLHDNVLVEFNTKPADSEDEFLGTIGTTLKNISSLVKKQGLELHLQASADFPAMELANPEASVFGCEPDFNAWILAPNQVPPDAAEKPFRSAGGHLHIGKSANDKLNAILDDDYGKVDVVKVLDIFCGIPSVFLDTDKTAPARRALYGGAGAHRPKPYGVEYRALGNWWLRSPSYVKLVYQLVKAALTHLVDGKMEELIKAIGEDKVQDIINKSKVTEAKKIYKKHILPLLSKETAELLETVRKEGASDFSASWSL
jgi:hypothetical protein